MKAPRYLFAAVLLAMFTLGCAKESVKREGSLNSAVEAYNESMRWQRYAEASKYVPDKLRDPFIEHFEPKRETLQITEFRIVSAELDKKDETKGKARVWLTFYELPNANLQKKLIIQDWKYNVEEHHWTIDLPEISKTSKN